MENNEEEWKKKLGEEKYHILREKGTEPAFSGEYVKEKSDGVYVCAACGNKLFDSAAKYDSGTGWPSFSAPVSHENVDMKPDVNFLVRRTEVVCGKCGSHLGHVFNDGPKPTGKRYCINSLALELKKK